MTQKDYIVRQVEAFTEALARVLALRDDRQYEAAAVMLAGLSERSLGLGLATLRALSPELRMGVGPLRTLRLAE